ncbi:hypothetical protein [uncultured Pontibacter sp.]|uniref:hypothetical protein n=1 Tax=uncultured Pontibacter sp. TaxID=453356 RepID=UPI002626AAD3|nr:hypothetical protein [uncultured Pontibacter sp.]
MIISKAYKNILLIKPVTSLGLLNFFTILIILLTKFCLITDELYYQSLDEKFSIDQITQLLNVQSKYEFASYILLVTFNLLKYGCITLILYIGIIIFGLKVKFNNVLKVVILAEFIFLIPLVLKFFWFYFFQSNYTLEDLQFFYPFSLLNIFDTGTISQIWVYPLQLLNIFEVIYWFFLAFGIKQLINSDFDKSLRLVLSSYLPAMLLWVVFIMFLTVTLNPNI